MMRLGSRSSGMRRSSVLWPASLSKRFGRPLLVGIDSEHWNLLWSDGFAQLRELPVSDRSCVAVDEDKHDWRFAFEIAQPDRIAIERVEFEVGCHLADFCHIDV